MKRQHRFIKPFRNGPLTPAEVFNALNEVGPDDIILVQETASNQRDLCEYWPTTKPVSFFAASSRVLGWGLPASIGIALAERYTGKNRPVILIVGDGAFQYSIQSLWTAAQHNLPILIVVIRNEEHAILKSFAEFEDTPSAPGIDIPNIDVISLAKDYGCDAMRLDNLEAIKKAAVNAWSKSKPIVLEIPISRQIEPLI